MAKTKTTDKRVNINSEIKAAEVRVIDPDGNQLGVITLNSALSAAEDFGLDLVEVSPNASPPVCKIMDYGRFRYQQDKKQQEARKKQSAIQVKEIKVRPKTDTHDLEIKLGHIKKFIGKKNKVKVTLMFRGREITMTDRGKAVLEEIAKHAEEFATIEQPPKMEGRTMTMVLGPK
ncbi:MAG: translation initiation factor IF-3 [Desulfobacterales bacterium]|nr:translation initiation factor IF-3 [Desulfobacterales bacterium]